MALKGMTEDELRTLPAVMSLEEAGRAWGIGRTRSHELRRIGQFPCGVVKVGSQYKVTKAALYRSLDLELPGAAEQSDVA